MNKVYLGTDYGGWVADIDFIKDGDTILDIGIGEDLSFANALLERFDVNIIGVDPTEQAHAYVEANMPNNYTLIKKAVAPYGTKKVTMFKKTNPDWCSESMFNDHNAVSNSESYEIDAISYTELREQYDNISLVKMSILGGEIDTLEECIGIPQICVEFFHNAVDRYPIEFTKDRIKMLTKNGYKVINNRNMLEMTFLKK